MDGRREDKEAQLLSSSLFIIETIYIRGGEPIDRIAVNLDFYSEITVNKEVYLPYYQKKYMHN